MKIRNILSFLLCVCLSSILFCNVSTKVYAEQSQVDKIVSFAKSKIGSTEYVGLCQAFVYQCYKAAGIDNGSASSAIAAWNKWGISNSKTDIPIGACVYFDERVGSQYGHVGIYIGNNKMIHSRQSVGKVVESSMTWYFDNCYLGWGWQGGVEPSSIPGQDSSSTTINDYYLLTSPDGYQTIRSSYSTTSNKVADILTPAIVCVTKYNSDGKWGYVSYNGYSGWIRLYYVEKHYHSYGAWRTTKEATCTNSGVREQSCECGLYNTEAIAALGHKYSADYTIDKAATCTDAGSKSQHCTRCNVKTNVTEIPIINHSYVYVCEEPQNEEMLTTVVEQCEICENIVKSYDVPMFKIEKLYFRNSKIECVVEKPNVDSGLSYMITVPFSANGQGIATSVSHTSGYSVYSIDDFSSISDETEITVELWFGLGKQTPHSFSVIDTKTKTFKSVRNDVNGDFLNDVNDLVALKKSLLGVSNTEVGDTNGDGTINVLDFISLDKYISTEI